MSRFAGNDEPCPFCGLRYGDLPSGAPTFAEAKAEMMRESREAAEGGDYSRPASRRAVLGRLFEYKQAAWEAHVHYCEEAEHSEIAKDRGPKSRKPA